MAGRWTEGGEKRCVGWKKQTSEKERARLTPKVPDEEAMLPLFIVPKWVRGAGKQEVSLVHMYVVTAPFAAGSDWSVRAVAIRKNTRKQAFPNVRGVFACVGRQVENMRAVL